MSTRPSVPALWWGQVRHANRSFWRTPVAAFFTLVFPLSFLVILLGVVGNPTLDDRSGIRLAQFLAPVFAVYGVAMASFASFAIGVATDRESGVLKRIRGTPLSPRLYLAGRVGSATWVSLIAVVLLLGVGVVVYEVEVLGRTWVALVVTLALGIACFATLGLAVVAVVHELSLLPRFADRVLVIDRGRAVAVGTPDAVLEPELVRRVFGLEVYRALHPASGATALAFDRSVA